MSGLLEKEAATEGSKRLGSSSYANLKEELRSKIKRRRASEGKSEITCLFKIPEKHELTAEEKQKLQLRKYRSRQSSRKCRMLKERQLELLEEKAKKKELKHRQLSKQVELLWKQKLYFTRILADHMNVCDLKARANTDGENDKIKKTTVTPPRVNLRNRSELKLTEISDSIVCELNDVKGGSPVPGLVEGVACNTNRWVCNTKNNKIFKSKSSKPYCDNMTKEKVVNLRNYLKCNQSKPAVQNFFRKLIEKTKQRRTEECPKEGTE